VNLNELKNSDQNDKTLQNILWVRIGDEFKWYKFNQIQFLYSRIFENSLHYITKFSDNVIVWEWLEQGNLT
jgi:hypothetical protein